MATALAKQPPGLEGLATTSRPRTPTAAEFFFYLREMLDLVGQQLLAGPPS